MSKCYTIIANWKMYYTFNEALLWARSNKKSLEALCKASNNKLVLCPSFESLYAIQQELANIPLFFGAQNCSDQKQGAFTGQISAQSLAEMGCTYCIVGHSEQREYQKEENGTIANKIKLLLENHLSPILCIGESKQEYEKGTTKKIIEEQLNLINGLKISPKNALYIAYEPRWAIGTGITPENDYLASVFEHIQNIAGNWPLKPALLYGGSVDAQSCKKLKEVSLIEGFLIGKAGTDFQELNKIMLSL